jgi:hypothetical protein
MFFTMLLASIENLLSVHVWCGYHQTADEKQVGQLLNYLDGVKQSTCPKLFPDFVFFTSELSC